MRKLGLGLGFALVEHRYRVTTSKENCSVKHDWGVLRIILLVESFLVMKKTPFQGMGKALPWKFAYVARWVNCSWENDEASKNVSLRLATDMQACINLSILGVPKKVAP